MKKPVKIKVSIPRKRSEVLVTRKMLFGVRDELKASITASEKRSGVQMNTLHSKIDTVQAEVRSIALRMDEQDARNSAKFDRIILRMEEQDARNSAEFSRLKVLIEEQNARNAVVLDGIMGVMERQEKQENEISDIRKIILPLK